MERSHGLEMGLRQVARITQALHGLEVFLLELEVWDLVDGEAGVQDAVHEVEHVNKLPRARWKVFGRQRSIAVTIAPEEVQDLSHLVLLVLLVGERSRVCP